MDVESGRTMMSIGARPLSRIHALRGIHTSCTAQRTLLFSMAVHGEAATKQAREALSRKSSCPRKRASRLFRSVVFWIPASAGMTCSEIPWF